MLDAMAAIDAIAGAERVEAVLRAGMQLARHLHCAAHARHVERRAASTRQLGIDEAEVERCVVRDQRRVAQEFDQLVDASREQGFVRQELDRQAVHGFGGGGHVALGIEIGVERDPALAPVDQFDAPDFDQPVPGFGIEPRGFGIENYLTHRSVNLDPIARGNKRRWRESGGVSRFSDAPFRSRNRRVRA